MFVVHNMKTTCSHEDANDVANLSLDKVIVVSSRSDGRCHKEALPCVN